MLLVCRAWAWAMGKEPSYVAQHAIFRFSRSLFLLNEEANAFSVVFIVMVGPFCVFIWSCAIGVWKSVCVLNFDEVFFVAAAGIGGACCVIEY